MPLEAEGSSPTSKPDDRYDAARAKAPWELLHGTVGAVVAARGVHVRDGGVIALLAQEAGALVRTRGGAPWDGAFDDRGRTVPLVIATDEGLAERLRAHAS